MEIGGGRIDFYKGFSDPNYPGIIINPTLPPKVSFWKYIGIKGSFNFIGGSTNIIEIIPDVEPYNEIVTPPGITETNVISTTVNGVLIYDYEITTVGNSNYLIMDESCLMYVIENDDWIRLEATST